MKKIYFLILFISLNTFGQCWESVSAGYTHSVGLKTDGSLWAWGENNFGQLGNGSTTDRNVPTQIGNSTNWIKVAAGNWYSLGIKSDGTLWAWGYNTFGQLGIVTATNQLSVPTQVGTATDWVTVSAGYNHTLAIKSNGTLWAWGSNSNGKLGINSADSQRNVPTQVGTATNWLKIAAGDDFSLGIQTDGRIWGWGYNASSQLGNGGSPNVVNAPVVTANTFGTYWMDVTAGYNHAIGISNSATPYVWGADDFGQLGSGSNTNTGLPWGIGLSESAEGVEAGLYHTFIILSSGKILGAGRNNYGQLGNGTTTSLESFTTIGTASDFAKLSAGGYHTLSIRTDGTLKACGRNDHGQLGDGTTTQRTQFVTISCPTTLAVEDFASTVNKLKVYPNPAQNLLSLSLNQKINKLAIYNFLGQEVISKTISANEGLIDISALTSGTYFVKVWTDHQTETVQFIKE